ncbi:ferritin family protein [Wenjunlia vitaminophila]|nr:ferritin family protein [Wenjunlia vitaminophila]
MASPLRRAVTSAGLALATVLVTAPLAQAGAQQPWAPLALSTVQDTRAAMRGEAFAHASYTLFAVQARHEDQDAAATLFRSTAATELNEHFTEEGELIDFVGSDESNIRQAIEGERHEAATMYPSFAEEAREDGDTKAAELFTELAADEDQHRKLLTTALKALTTGTVDVPAPPTVDPVKVRAGLPKVSSARTRHNLDEAMHGEALANAAYTLYARHAELKGQHKLAELFRGLAKVELREHFAGEAKLAGLVSRTANNLRASIAGERYEAKVMYPAFAARARAAGDVKAADLFAEIAGDEARHAAAFKEALEDL